MAKKKGQKPENSGKRPAPKKTRGKGSWWIVPVVAAITVVVGLLIFAFFGERLSGIVKKPGEPAVKRIKEFKEVSLYFVGEDGKSLIAEKRMIQAGGLEDEVRETVRAVIEGPKTGLDRTIPIGTALLGVKIKDGVATADFSPEIKEKHWGGSSAEIQTVYSIVNSIAINFPEVKKVRLLVAGQKQDTIAGHIDISEPLAPDRSFIKG
ncbi:MAG: GerMN domain-containing protein [Deltaproteobacteria bacterium]|nr:GerMN domain-containing protein [Deltaproteobacteria bacterium]